MTHDSTLCHAICGFCDAWANRADMRGPQNSSAHETSARALPANSPYFLPSAGQFGALLRWQLARFNARLPGRLHWFPAGTFAANLLACAVIYAFQAVINTQPGYWVLVVGIAIEKGFCGALSTVSTLVNEVRARSGYSIEVALAGESYKQRPRPSAAPGC